MGGDVIHGAHEDIEQAAEDFVAGDFDLHAAVGGIDRLAAHLLDFAKRGGGGDHVGERRVEFSREQAGLVVEECGGALREAFADGHRAQHFERGLARGHAIEIARVPSDDREECIAHGLVAEVAEARAVLEVHEAVADVVRGLDEECERVPRPAFRCALDEPAVLGDFGEVLALTLKVAEFFQARADVRHGAEERGVGIFCK